MPFKWRKWNRIIHRDFGYFFFGMTIIYGVSGIALNHKGDWNPSYRISNYEVNVPDELLGKKVDKQNSIDILEYLQIEDDYKKHYFPDNTTLKIFFNDGSTEIDMITGEGYVETIKRRPFLYEVNFLHYNPGVLWKWFSDIYGGALVLIAISGLFILKGRKGIKGRGLWLTMAGVLLPLILFFLYT